MDNHDSYGQDERLIVRRSIIRMSDGGSGEDLF